jgi:hypothetical protein
LHQDAMNQNPSRILINFLSHDPRYKFLGSVWGSKSFLYRVKWYGLFFVWDVDRGETFPTIQAYTPSVSKYILSLTFFYNFDHSSYSKKIVHIQFILFAICFIVCNLSSIYHFTCLR